MSSSDRPGFENFYLVFPPGVCLERRMEYASDYKREVLDPLEA
jgi:hypothetical protein